MTDQPGNTEYTSLIAFRDGRSRPVVCCVHSLGSSVLHYGRLRKHLPTDQPIVGFQGQGLDGDAVTRLSVADMARHYVGELSRAQPKGPYVLVGHCSGGLIALEMARQLQSAGKQVLDVVLVDTKSPELRLKTLSSLRARLDEALADMEHEDAASDRSAMQALLDAAPYNVARRTYKWFLSKAARCHVALGRKVPIRMRAQYVISSNRRIIQAFRPLPYQYDGHLTAIRTLDMIDLPADLGWSHYVRGRVRTATVHGNHMFMREDPEAIKDFADLLKQSGQAKAAVTSD